MPHDKNNNEIHAGDLVTVTFKVRDVSPNAEFCNATLESVVPMYPSENKTVLTVNTKQVELKMPNEFITKAELEEEYGL